VIVPLQIHKNWLRKPIVSYAICEREKQLKKIISRYELWWHSNAIDDENVPADVTVAAATATGPRTMDRGNVRETTVTFVRGHLATDGGGGTYRKTIENCNGEREKKETLYVYNTTRIQYKRKKKNIIILYRIIFLNTAARSNGNQSVVGFCT